MADGEGSRHDVPLKVARVEDVTYYALGAYVTVEEPALGVQRTLADLCAAAKHNHYEVRSQSL